MFMQNMVEAVNVGGENNTELEKEDIDTLSCDVEIAGKTA